MANTIELAEKFLPILDAIYKKSSVTAFLDALTQPVDFAGAATVNVMKLTTVGLGDYSRANGYPAGDVDVEWEPMQLTKDRGRDLQVDRMDNEETLGTAFGRLADEFIRLHVGPELDAYRFSVYATGAGLGATAALSTAEAALAAIDVAQAALDDVDVPDEMRILFLANPIYRLLVQAVPRSIENDSRYSRILEMLDNSQIVKVPQSRFYTEIALDDGSETDEGGFANAGGKINFMLMHPTARLQVAKHANLKIFTPDENQTADKWKFQYRIYHDAWVYDNKADGIYVHARAEAS